MRQYWSYTIFLWISVRFMFSQVTCVTGGMSIYSTCGPGRGCVSGCNLSEFSWFGSMCNGTSSPGDCSPSQNLTSSFSIPSGCTATLSASFRTRCDSNGCTSCGTSCSNTGGGSGCGASGMDSGDELRVGGNSTSPVYTSSTSITGSPTTNTTTNASGYTLTATGSSNAGVLLQYAQTGGNMFVNVTANRSDEIVTFTLQIQNGCDCSNVLPVDIYSFYAIPKNGFIELKWITKNELHLSNYRIEKSKDGVHYSKLFDVPSENRIEEKVYTAIDDNPHPGVSYYKLIPVNKNGIDENYIIQDVVYQLKYNFFDYSLKEENLTLRFENFDIPTSFSMIDLSGKNIYQINEISQNEYIVSTQIIPKGIYMGIIQNRYQVYTYKIIVM